MTGSGGGRARADPKRDSPRPGCRVCALPSGERALLNGGLLAGWSPRRLSARFGTISRKDVIGHMTMCVNAQESEEA